MVQPNPPRFLREGGFCHFLAQWGVPAGGDRRTTCAGWFEGNGCDVWILCLENQDLERYAAMWVSEDQGHGAPREVFDRWVEFYERSGFESIQTGFVTMRPSTAGQPWFRAEDTPANISHPCGDDVLLAFEARDFVEKHDDPALLDSRLRLAPPVRLIQRWHRPEGAWDVETTHLRRDAPLGYVWQVDRLMAELADRLDGGRPLRDVLGELAAAMGTDLPSIAAETLADVRVMIENLFLLPVGPDDDSGASR